MPLVSEGARDKCTTTGLRKVSAEAAVTEEEGDVIGVEWLSEGEGDRAEAAEQAAADEASGGDGSSSSSAGAVRQCSVRAAARSVAAAICSSRT
eukprot:832362-Prymnesium_polylepis.2